MRALRFISTDTLNDPPELHTPALIDKQSVWNALISIQKHISKLITSIKNLSGNRTSGTINLCAIDSARRLNEKLQHGGIHYAHCH